VEIQGFLPEVFDDLGKARRDIVGRLTVHQVSIYMYRNCVIITS
jgi:hypothetical protein